MTEQQLRERVEEVDFILMQLEDYTHGEDGNKITHARKILQKLKSEIDFHKQELQRIGEVVYVPVTVGIETFPKETGFYFTIQQEDAHGEASIFVSHFDGSGFEMPRYCAQPTHWLKKLSLLEVKDK